MKKILILIIMLFSGIMITKADVCGGGEIGIEIQGRYHCIGVSVTQQKKENVLVNFNAYYYDDVYYIAISKSDLIYEGIDKQPLTINTYLYDDMNLENYENVFVIKEQNNGKKDQYLLNGELVFKESFEITENNDSYESNTKYTVYEDINCIEKNTKNPYEYCRTTLYTKPTFIVTIIDDTAWNLDNQEECVCENKSREEKCEDVKCAEPLTFVEYLQNDNILLGVIILVPTMLLVTTVIFIVRYKKLKKNKNK